MAIVQDGEEDRFPEAKSTNGVDPAALHFRELSSCRAMNPGCLLAVFAEERGWFVSKHLKTPEIHPMSLHNASKTRYGRRDTNYKSAVKCNWFLTVTK